MSLMTSTVEEFPLLAFDLKAEMHPSALVLERGDDLFEVTGLGPSVTWAALNEMRGDRSMDAIGSVSGASPAELNALCSNLAAAGVVTFIHPNRDEEARREILDPDSLVQACTERFPAWKARLFSGPLWTKLSSGAAPQHLFVGWLIESYFFIEAVTARLPVAIAGAQDPAVRRLFAKHFTEEFDHHHFFRRALEAAGVDLANLKERAPLPGTMAIRNHMRHCGRRDPLAYATCSGFLESTGEDRATAHAFFEQLAAHFDSGAAPIVAPLAEHARLDEDYQHSGMLQLVAQAIGPVTRARAEAALEAARLLVETLEVWSTDILRHYSDERGLMGGVRRYRPLQYEVAGLA